MMKNLVIFLFSMLLGSFVLKAQQQEVDITQINVPNEQVLYKIDDATGKIIYLPDAYGNIIPDFSKVGYKKGSALPNVETKITLNPSGKDDTQAIERAINSIAKMPLNLNGFRGALLLKKGTYFVSKTITLVDSGIVIRGEGSSDLGTIIIATKKEEHDLFVVGKKENYQREKGKKRRILGDYIPVGTTKLTLASTKGLKVGDLITVLRPSTSKWIRHIGMDKIEPREDGRAIKQWLPGKYDLTYERTITAISQNTITIDIPLVSPLEKKYGGAYVYKTQIMGRVHNIGFENLKLKSIYETGQENADEDHAWNAILFDYAENAWAQNIICHHFAKSCVSVGKRAKFITVNECKYLEPVSKIMGRRRYSFSVQGQMTLVKNCYSNGGRHDYITNSRVPGPNVFYNCKAENTHSDSGPHSRWATGTLYDNVEVETFKIQNRGNFGSGHGWSGAWEIVWNCTAENACIQKPPTANNYVFGFIGKKSKCRFPEEDAYWFSYGEHVNPRSLYLKQLEDNRSN